MSARDVDEEEFRSRTQQSPLARERAKTEKGAAEGSRKGGFKLASVFPLGYKETFSQWWASVPAAVAEHNVMSFIPFLLSPPTHSAQATAVRKPMADGSVSPSTEENLERVPSASAQSRKDPYGTRQWQSTSVKLSGKDRALNEFSVQRLGEEINHNLVMLHGYGAGLAFFYKNFESLSRTPGWKIYALDLLGMGRSSRPPFKIKSKDRQASIEEAENWFVDSLEEWRKDRKLDRFTLFGHSLGGYLAVCYALKYPGHLNKLILVSPVGIPEDPYAVQAELPEPPESSIAAEFSQDQETQSTAPGLVSTRPGDQNNFLNARKDAEVKEKSTSGNGPPPRKPLPKWLTYLWDANISPFSLVRWSGPLGPRFVSGWTSRRFSHLPPEEAQALHTYAYTLFKQRGSGEYALAYLLAPGAFARSPLIRRIGGVGRQLLPKDGTNSPIDAEKTLDKETGFPVVFVYGENDWMDVKGGYASKKILDEERSKALLAASEEEKKLEKGNSRVCIVRNAGHHVYLDGWDDFNNLMRRELDELSK